MSHKFLIDLAVAAFEILIGAILGPIVKKLILKLKLKGVDPGVLTFLGSFASIFIMVIMAIIALAQIGVNTSVIVGAFSAMGLGISLSLKESMANVAGGIQILLTKPFVLGNYIGCLNSEGTVEEIELMFTTLKTVGNQMVVIPNATLVSNQITNYSAYENRRLALSIPSGIFDDYDQFRQGLLKIMEENPKVLKDPAPVTVIDGFNPDGTGMNIKMVCYTLLDDYWKTYYEINEQVQILRSRSSVSAPVNTIRIDAGKNMKAGE